MNAFSIKTKLVIFLPTILLVLLLGILSIYLFASGTINAMIHGPKVVMEVNSPDGQYLAYVVDEPCLDGPNQSLMIERSDKTRFLRIARLVGDVDSIKEILWSPDSSIVVFHSWLYLTIARSSDWSMIRIYLGDEWRRHEPIRRTTFSGAMPKYGVETIDFPEPAQVAYKLKGQPNINIVKIDFLPERH